MSDSLRPHRRQPTRLPHPWDSPGKNTGMGCHFLLQCRKVKSESEVAQLCPTLPDPMDCSPPGSSVPGILQARVLEWGAIAFSLGSTMEVQLFLAGCAAPRPAAARQTHVTRGSYQQSGECKLGTLSTPCPPELALTHGAETQPSVPAGQAHILLTTTRLCL